MYARLTALVLHWLRVPPEPHAPHGDPASLRVFRAGRNFYNLRLARWGFTQLIAFAGIVFWVTVIIDVESEVHNRQLAHQTRVDPRETKNAEEYLDKIGATEPAQATPPTDQQTTRPKKVRPKPLGRINGWTGFKLMLVQAALWLPPWGFPLLWVLKIAGILAYLAQLPFTYLIARLDFEMRWYMVTDRSLRIRYGVWKVNESTMSFANIQQVEVSQGPLQRLLGLADVRVQSAGGGGGGDHDHRHGTEDDMHHGLFHSVTNATEIRDLILDRLRRYRESGLGDPEEKSPHPEPATAPAASSGDLLAAARELAAEARALRSAM